MQGNTNRKIRVMTEMIMKKSKENIEERKEQPLTVGQYNSVYEAVQDLLEGNV